MFPGKTGCFKVKDYVNSSSKDPSDYISGLDIRRFKSQGAYGTFFVFSWLGECYASHLRI